MSTVTKLSGREFNQNTSEAKKAAEKGPVFIYRRLEGRGRKITVLLYMEGVAELEFAIPTLPDVAVAADLS